VRPLPFDSLDHLLVAAGVDLKAWRGVAVVTDQVGELPPAAGVAPGPGLAERGRYRRGETLRYLVDRSF
jgi:hypothetical protein